MDVIWKKISLLKALKKANLNIPCKAKLENPPVENGNYHHKLVIKINTVIT